MEPKFLITSRIEWNKWRKQEIWASGDNQCKCKMKVKENALFIEARVSKEIYN